LRLGTWNVRSLYRAGSLKAAARELARYKLDLVGVQEVRWDKGGTVRAEDYNFFYGKGNENHQLGTGFDILVCSQLYTGLLKMIVEVLTPTAHSNRFQLFHDSGNGVTNTRCCRYSCMRS
jgi:exonuclease III